MKRTPFSIARASIKALRPKQWAKNVLILAPVVFSSVYLTDPMRLLDAVLAVASFSLLASSGYLLNDYLDREADRKHPKKSKRPIASGALPEGLALVEMVVVLLIGAGIAWYVSPVFLVLGLAYLATTMFYSFVLKHVVILDVMVLSSFYLLRVIAGAAAIEVRISEWLFLCTAFLALFIGFHKRRAELVQLGQGGGTRKILEHYSLPMLDQFQAIVTGAVVLCYALYTVIGSATPWMVLSMPFVLYGIFRYIWLVDQRGEGDAPDETLIKDGPILVTGLLYGLTVVGILIAHNFELLPDIFAAPLPGRLPVPGVGG